jgi:hypothetical protein
MYGKTWPAPLAEMARRKRIKSFDLDGVGSIPAIPRRRLPALLIFSIN